MDNKVFDFHEIKTFADACEKLGMKEHLLTGSMGGDRETQGQAQALYKLLIIQKAMNNGVWCDKDGWSYYPYWVLYSKEEMERMSEEEEKAYLDDEMKLAYKLFGKDKEEEDKA